jgi:hypothetical protein
MSTKFEQLLDLLVNEEMDKANELFHEIVVEKSREIYENMIAEEADEEMDESNAEDEEMDEAKEQDDEELDESSDDEEMDEGADEELEDSYMMDGDDEEANGMGGDATDDMLGDIEVDGGDDGEEGGSEDAAIMDIKNAIAELEAAFADLEAAQGGGDGEMDMDSEFGDEEDDEEADNDMMGLREYRETVGNDWEKSGSQKTPGPVGSGKGDLAGQTSVDSGKSPVSSGKGKPTTGASAKNILGDTKTGEGTNVGTKPTGKAGGLVGNVKGEFTKGVEKNIAGSASAKMKSGSDLGKQGAGYPGNNKTAGPVGSGTGDKAGQTSVHNTPSPLNGAPNRNA